MALRRRRSGGLDPSVAAVASAVVDALPGNIAVLDRDGTVRRVNASWRRFAVANGFQGPDCGVGDNYLAVCDRASGDGADTARAVAARLRRLLQDDGPSFTVDYECHAPDTPRWFRLRAHRLDGPAHDGVVVMHMDITEQTRAEAAARASIEAQERLTAALAAEEARLVAAQAVAKIGSWETDLGTLSVVWSAETHRIFGTDRATFEPTHAAFLEMVHPDDRAMVQAAFLQQTISDTPHRIEHRIIAADGTRKHVEERWQVQCDATGRPVRAIGTCQDITERRALEQQFLRAQRIESVGALVGGIAHDLNNVLAPILMAVDLLRDRVDDETGRGLLTTLEESAARGADLVQQVLTFARGAEPVRVSVQVDAVVRDLVKVMRETFPKSIDVRSTAAPSPWAVSGNRTQIHQVILNLCVNARDAMPAGGVLTIAVDNVIVDETFAALQSGAHPGPHVRVRVSDTGTGIPADLRDRIFEPFFTTKDAGKGTGLGLSTTQAIVISHGGFMHLTSELGRGTTFDAYFPAHGARADAPPSPDAGAPLRPRGRGECLLVVDDEDAVRSIAQRLLARYGYRVLVAAHGADAMSLFAEHQADIALILTDMTMPVMDGAALITAARSLDPGIKVIASSGRASGASVGRALAAGANRFVPKPYSTENLLAVIREVLDHDAT